jgi:O-antigen/teichoic acid export membrane protein
MMSIYRSKFSSNILKILFGNMGAQLVTFVTIPIITRIYGPSGYGTMAIFLALSQLFFPISSLRYGNAVLLPKKECDAAGLVVVSLLLTVLFSIILGLFIAIFGQELENLKTKGSGFHFLFWLPLVILFAGAYQVLNSWAIRQNDFKWMGLSRFVQKLSERGFAVGLGLTINGSAFYLVLSHLLGRFIALICLIYRLVQNVYSAPTVWKQINVETLRKVTNNYSSFAKYSGSVFILELSRQILPLLLSVVYGTVIVGYFQVGSRIIGSPMMMISDSIERSFFNEATLWSKRGLELAPLFKKILSHLLKLTVLPLTLFALASDEIVILMLGDEWNAAGFYLRVFCAFFLFRFLHRPFSIILDIENRHRVRLIFNSISLLWCLSLIGISKIVPSPKEVVLIFVIGDSLIYIVGICWLLNCAGIKYTHSIKSFLYYGLISAAVVLFMNIIKMNFTLYNSYIIIIICLLILLYFLYIGFKYRYFKKIIHIMFSS